jgi:integrase
MEFRYTHKYKRSDGGLSWRFIPPDDAKAAGVVENVTFKDGRTAKHEIPKLLELVDKFRKGEIKVGRIGSRSTLRQVFSYYTNSFHFKNLAYTTEIAYTYGLHYVNSTKVFGKELGDMSVCAINPQHCSEAYQLWCETVSVANGNKHARLISVLLNYCVSLDLIPNNPMAKVQKQSHEPRSIVWTKDQVELFLDTAFEKFDYRNIGLLVLMCYEWGQRPVDIRNLIWDNIDFESQKITITQSKRGATVILPVEGQLMDMLSQQFKDWGWQQYVIPHQRPSDGCYVPFSCSQVGEAVNEVKALCDLPSDLQAGDLRKTAINEMIESGVDQLAIMSVTGHKNVQSLNPYNKHNYNTARKALERRKNT